MKRYLAKIRYLGLNYNGSQKQDQNLEPKQRTIQNELENALRTLTKRNISTIFQGRTDAKVSAYAQTLHFDMDDEIENIQKFIYSLNSILPNDIVVFEIMPVENNFHAQMSAKYRHYQYKIRSSKTKSPFDLNVFYMHEDLNIERINKMLGYIVGEHDFSAFKSKSDNPAKICKIFKAEAKKEGEYVLIDIIGNRFLYNMVRTIVGTILRIEKTSKDPELFEKILNSKMRSNAYETIEAVGLTLVEVGYDNSYEILQ